MRKCMNVHSVLRSGLPSPNDYADQPSLRDRLPIKARQRNAAIRECSMSLQRQQILSSAVNFIVLSFVEYLYVKLQLC